MGCSVPQQCLCTLGGTCCVWVTDISGAVIHIAVKWDPCFLPIQWSWSSFLVFLCCPWLLGCCGQSCVLQVSGSWMPASHLFAEQVSDFPRACLNVGDPYCSTLHRVSLCFVDCTCLFRWNVKYESKTETSFKQSLWLEKADLNLFSFLGIICGAERGTEPTSLAVWHCHSSAQHKTQQFACRHVYHVEREGG